MKHIYVIRYCSATDQQREAILTNKGLKDRQSILNLLEKENLNIDKIYCSPFIRTQQTAEPLESLYNKKIQILDLLAETQPCDNTNNISYSKYLKKVFII